MFHKKEDKSVLVIGGGLLAGLGLGFFFLQENVLAFVACLLIGLGLGLVLAPFVPRK